MRVCIKKKKRINENGNRRTCIKIKQNTRHGGKLKEILRNIKINSDGG